MKITIDGIRLDTEKASQSWTLYWADDRSNAHSGHIYRSSKGQWYVYTPSQWSNQHTWELSTAANILNDYDKYLNDEQKTQIAELGELTFD